MSEPPPDAPHAPTHAADGRRRRRVRRERPLWQAIAINMLAALVVVSLVQAFLVRVHNVTSGSMQNTLGVSDRVLTSRLPFVGGGPARGDIVIFAHGDTWDSPIRPPDPNPMKQAVRWFGDLTGLGISDYEYTVKRVIGVGGDTVSCCDSAGHVLVNGTAIDEPYLYQDLPLRPGSIDCASNPRSARCFAPIQVPAGKLLVMGDHRSNSSDSVVACRGDVASGSCARFVDVGQVTGKVIGRAWPPGPVG